MKFLLDSFLLEHKLCTLINKGGLAEEVDEKILQSAFLPFGDTIVQIPLDYATGLCLSFDFKKLVNLI